MEIFVFIHYPFSNSQLIQRRVLHLPSLAILLLASCKPLPGLSNSHSRPQPSSSISPRSFEYHKPSLVLQLSFTPRISHLYSILSAPLPSRPTAPPNNTMAEIVGLVGSIVSIGDACTKLIACLRGCCVAAAPTSPPPRPTSPTRSPTSTSSTTSSSSWTPTCAASRAASSRSRGKRSARP